MQPLAHLAHLAGTSFITGLWQGLALASLAWLCLHLLPRIPAAARFVVWSIVLVVIALLPLLEDLQFDKTSAVPMQQSGSLLQIDARWSLAIGVLWLLLSLLRAGDLTLHAVRLWSMRKRSTLVEHAPNSPWAAALNRGHRPVQLSISTEVDRPGVIGFFSPRILIPAWLYSQLTAAELEQIVLHETEHLRRRDDWLNLLQKLSLVFFPLNPILFWIERRLCFERELACDDGVLRRTLSPRAYATCLTSLAERGLDHRVLSLALGTLGSFGVAARQSELARRVHRILRRENTLSPRKTHALMGAVAVGLLSASAGLTRCPQLISFAGPTQVRQAEARLGRPYPAVTSRPDAPMRDEQVVFKQERQPHLTLLKASLPQRSPSAVSNFFRTRKRRSIKSPVTSRTAIDHTVKITAIPRTVAVDQNRGWIVLTSWSATDQSNPTLPVAVPQPLIAPRYAAVPTMDGWLIVQL